MKKKSLMISLILIFTAAQSALAQYPDPFLTEDERPTPYAWLLPPPEFTSSAFMNDFYYYQWGKEQRDSGYVSMFAVDDEGTQLYKVFNGLVDVELSHENTPEILKLVEGGVSDIHVINSTVKDFYKRKRPFATFNEPSLKPEEDSVEANTYSYPSGHACRGYMFAMLLSLIAPEYANGLMMRAEIYALNRLICGHHWKSDIDASQKLVAGVFPVLMTNEKFQEQLAKARKEYAEKTGKSTSVSSVRAKSADDKWYNLQGQSVTAPQSSGIFIHKGNKVAVR